MQTIGFVGLGKIGLPICENLIKSGYRVLGYRRSSLAEIEKIGAVPARSPAEIAGFDALAADRLDCTVRAQIADRDVRSSGRHFSLDVRRARMSLRVHDFELLMQRRKTNRSDLALVVPIGAQPPGFRHSIHLQELYPVHLLEALPLLRRQGSAAAGHQP